MKIAHSNHDVTQAAIVAAELIVETAIFIPDGTGGGYLAINDNKSAMFRVSIDKEGNIRGVALI